MHCVFLLRSAVDGRRGYVGVTGDLRARVASHNAGRNPSTVHGRPWRVVAYIALADSAKARALERFLKSGSGRIFARRHLL